MYTRAYMAQQYGFWRNTNMVTFEGLRDIEGYRCDLVTRERPGWWAPSVGIYDFRLNPDAPLTWVMGVQACRFLEVPDGSEMQPDGAFLTDKASIPWFVPMARDRFLGAYTHDAQYKTHRCWLKFPEDKEWSHRIITKEQSDMMLYFSTLADPVPLSFWQAELVWFAVARFGDSAWAKGGVL